MINQAILRCSRRDACDGHATWANAMACAATWKLLSPAVTADLNLTHVNHASSPLSTSYTLLSHTTHRTAPILAAQTLSVRSLFSTAQIPPQIENHRRK